MAEPTDYTNSGFDKLLSRGDAPNLSGQLDVQTPNNSLPADRTQITGPMGDTLRLGNILLDGANSRILMKDSTGTDVLLIGEDI